MLVPTLIMAVLAAALILIAHFKGGNREMQGLTAAWRMILSILPMLLAAFVVAGMVQVLIPQETIARWVGGESGTKGLLIGTVAGGLTPGGPYVSLPIVAGFLEAGAGIGTMVAFLTAWSLWAVARIPMEVGILGWKFTAVRIGATFFVPPIAGLLAKFIYAALKL